MLPGSLFSLSQSSLVNIGNHSTRNLKRDTNPSIIIRVRSSFQILMSSVEFLRWQSVRQWASAQEKRSDWGTVRMDGSQDAAQRMRWQRKEGELMRLIAWTRLSFYRLDTSAQTVVMKMNKEIKWIKTERNKIWALEKTIRQASQSLLVKPIRIIKKNIK